jgi:16S rRNA (adenine1518-N6/adenine1519-N6)-dimethyltransferase
MEALPLRASEVVFEIGPGKGAMTALLAERARKVIAIEIDRALVQKLQEDFARDSRVQIMAADVLSVDFGALCCQEGTGQAFVFGNLPYYITSPILHHLLAHRGSIRAMGLLIQREVAARLTAEPGTRNYGYLTVATQIYSQPESALAVPPGAFSPPPKVYSTLVTFQMNPRFPGWTQEKCQQFLEFTKRCFSHKRKTLVNNLTAIFSREGVLGALADRQKAQKLRAEELSIEELAALFERLAKLENRDSTPSPRPQSPSPT